jgi:hypothetical protein
MTIDQENESATEEIMVEEFSGGGKIFERYKEDDRPKRWLCGRDGEGNLTDPPEIKPGMATHYRNSDGEMEGANPTDAVLDEQEMWGLGLKPPTTERRDRQDPNMFPS